MIFAGKIVEFIGKRLKLKLSRSLDNQCWSERNFLLNEEKFKFLVHSDDGEPWLATTDQEISKLVEDLTKTRGLQTTEKFTVLTNISVQCQGGDKWNFSSTDGSDRLPSHFDVDVRVL